MKKLYSLVLIITFILSFSVNAVASTKNELSFYYEEYATHVENGTIDESISFDTWYQFIIEQQSLMNQLSSSDDFELVYDSSISPNSTYSMQLGDVFITNKSISTAMVGHAGIVITVGASFRILHIVPNETPSAVTLSNWHTTFTNREDDSWTKIYRHTSSSAATTAGVYAKSTYYGTDVPYSLTGSLFSTDKTYCSKIVYQAYYEAGVAEEYTYGLIGPTNLTTSIPGLRRQITYNSGDI
ncbi:MAG: hypothetical protein IIY11_09050 [Clostridia bacterium]|nr:hypothetical protein [Clostridia bacterium]MBQ2327019.1 hypothetical protein [Clostridia bacterium]